MESTINQVLERSKEIITKQDQLNDKLDKEYLPRKEFELQFKGFKAYVDEKYGMPRRVIIWLGTVLGGILFTIFIGAIVWAVQQQAK